MGFRNPQGAEANYSLCSWQLGELVDTRVTQRVCCLFFDSLFKMQPSGFFSGNTEQQLEYGPCTYKSVIVTSVALFNASHKHCTNIKHVSCAVL